MKTAIIFLVLLVLTFSLSAQKKNKKQDTTYIKLRCGGTINHDKQPLYVLDGLPIDKTTLSKISPKDITSISVLKNQEAISCYGSLAVNGVILLSTSLVKEKKCKVKTYPFKVYCVENTNWVRQQDIYNALEANVPSLRVTDKNSMGSVPKFNIRGDDDTIVIVDGIRYDASVLNSLNPNDIESIKVAPSVAATNYFAYDFWN